MVVAGYSLGGNLALKLAGEYGDAPPPSLRAVCAVSPVMELAACVRALERRQNIVYQWNFVRGLKARMRRKGVSHPGRFPIDRLIDVRTVRQFDEVFTAPHFGFAGADDYYHRASAMRTIDRIRVPALIISAEDDPFVPPEPFSGSPHRGQPAHPSDPHAPRRALRVRVGRLCGDDGYWAERQIVEFAEEALADDSAARCVLSFQHGARRHGGAASERSWLEFRRTSGHRSMRSPARTH